MKPNKKIWNKLTKYQQRLWKVLFDKFFHAENYPPNLPMSQKQVEVIAHNLALIAVWEIGGDRYSVER